MLLILLIMFWFKIILRLTFIQIMYRILVPASPREQSVSINTSVGVDGDPSYETHKCTLWQHAEFFYCCGKWYIYSIFNLALNG